MHQFHWQISPAPRTIAAKRQYIEKSPARSKGNAVDRNARPQTLPLRPPFADCYVARARPEIPHVPAAQHWPLLRRRVELRAELRSLCFSPLLFSNRRAYSHPETPARKKLFLPPRSFTPAMVGSDTRSNPQVRARSSPTHQNWPMYTPRRSPPVTIATRLTMAGCFVRRLRNAESRLAVSVT